MNTNVSFRMFITTSLFIVFGMLTFGTSCEQRERYSKKAGIAAAPVKPAAADTVQAPEKEKKARPLFRRHHRHLSFAVNK